MTQIDDAIAELEAEAALAKHEHPKHEGNLRTLIDELRVTSAAAAVRLQPPPVGTPFGVPLSRARSWSALALFVIAIGLSHMTYDRSGYFLLLDLAIDLALVVGLLGRLTWARAAVAGLVAWNLLDLGMWAAACEGDLWLAPIDGVIFALQGGILALTMPWKRGEIRVAGYALGLISVVYTGACVSTWALAATTTVDPEVGSLVQLATLLLAVGLVMRARWAAFVALACGGALLATAIPAAQNLYAVFPQMIFVNLVLGAVAAFGCAAISWHTARSWRGSLRGFAS